MKQQHKWPRGWNYRLTGIITVVFMILAVFGFYLTQTVLLKNAQYLGNELASRYAEMELQNVHTSEMLLSLGVQELDRQIAIETEQTELEQWAQNFFQAVEELSDNEIVPYAMIHNTLITAAGKQENYDIAQTDWYQQVLQSNGQTMISSTRSDSENGRIAITIAQKCSNSDNMIAFELYLKDMDIENAVRSLPEGSSYYLCNAEGDLLYAKTQLQVPQEQLEQHIRTIFNQIKSNQLDDAQQYIYDLVEEKRAVYSHVDENGGVSIITIPYSALLGDLRRMFYWFIAIWGPVLLFLIFMSIREYQFQKKLSFVNETVAALGNLYYSIYRINWVQGTYEAIKSAEDISKLIPDKGRYDQLLEVIGQVIDQDTFIQFKNSFSLQNVRELVEKNISDFGGDFRRLFGTEYRWVNVRLLFDTALQRNEAILCFRQVDQEKTRQLQQLQVLENALDRAKESESAREQFFSQMSHDMRTPLNVIIGTAELAEHKLDDKEKMGDCLKKIEVSAQHLLELINDILEISRMEQTDLRLKNDPCDLQATISQCLSAFQSQAELQHKNLEVTFDLTYPRVYADAFRLQQVLNNLVSNAMKFTNEGDRIEVEVSQSPQKVGGVCRIIVRDTGIGMSEEFLPRLFTPYARESRFNTQTVLGTGLGMTIVKTIVSRMEGQIQVESTLGKGTEFTLTIPMDPVMEETQPSESPKATTESLRGKRILLVEDFQMNLEIATELLKLCGAQVTPATNGKEAVDIFCASELDSFDVILMDMNMPVMDGCTAATKIRALDRPDAATIPILAVTANAFAEDIAATARAGMNAHIAKPIDLNQLAAVLHDLTPS